MEKIKKAQFDFDLEEIGTKLLIRRYNLDHRPINSLSDVMFFLRTYFEEYGYYIEDLKHNNCDVPEELHFIFNLTLIDGIKFIIELYREFGFFYYPNPKNYPYHKDYDQRYFNAKKRFIAKKNKVNYRPTTAEVSNIAGSVFPNKEVKRQAMATPLVSMLDDEYNELENSGNSRVRKSE